MADKDKDNKTRRSTRQPVPNPIYLQGISQLKSVMLFLFSKTLSEISESLKTINSRMSAMKTSEIRNLITNNLSTTTTANSNICPAVFLMGPR